MKIFKSIKWRLQLWYGLILVVVLAGFGFTAYQLERGQLFGRIDDELHRRVGILTDLLHRPPPRRPDMGEQPSDRPPPDQLPAGNPPLQKNRPLREFHLPPEDAHFFDANDSNNFYYAINSLRDHKQIASSTNVPNPPFNISIATESVESANAFSEPPAKLTAPTVRTIGNYREIDHLLPSGDIIYVGCSIVPELTELHHTALKLAGVGVIILFLGLAGGWWLVGRAIRPIADISATAVKISAGDMSQRINVAEAESELGQLASVFNATFARLEAAFAQQQQFTADAAHELRTPVSVMLTQTQTALNRERSAAEYRETLEACQRATQRMRKLIESLLELARLDAGQEPMKRMKFDLSQTAWDCVELVRPLAAERGVKIHCELPAVEWLWRCGTAGAGHHQPAGQCHSIQQGQRRGPHQREIAGQHDSPGGQRHGAGNCQRRICRTCSSGFIALTNRVHRAKPASAWRFPRPLSRRTAEPLKFQANRGPGPLSPWCCRCECVGRQR